MLPKLKRGIRRAKDVLRALFRGRIRKTADPQPEPYLKHADWDGLKLCADVLVENANKSGPLASSVTALSTCIEVFESQVGTHEEYIKLAIDLNDMLCMLSKYFDGARPLEIPQDRVANLSWCIDKETELLRRNQGGVEQNARIITETGQVLECYRRLRVILGRFIMNESMDIWKILDGPLTDTRLAQFPHSPESHYRIRESERVRRHGCMLDTRVDVLQQLRDWTHYNDYRKIFWLSGIAGTGKTTISYSLCEQLESTGRLAGSFFCSRQLSTCRRASHILPSISYQLSCLSRPFRCVLATVLEQNQHAHQLEPTEQLEKLVIAPLRRTKHTFPGDLVVVIDALDECEDTDGVNGLLDALLAHEPDNMPIKFFITSRTVPNIMDRIRSKQCESLEQELCLHEIDYSVSQNDIRRYLRNELAHFNLPETRIDNLAQQSGFLFLYADILADYIRHGNISWEAERLKKVLSTCTAFETDIWYTTILRGILEHNALEDTRRIQVMLILRAIVCAEGPVSGNDIADILEVDSIDLIRDLFHLLWPLLEISGEDGTIAARYQSFLRYLQDQQHSSWFDQYTQRQVVRRALAGFELINGLGLHHNICNLESSYFQDQAVPDIGERVDSKISNQLLRACQQWGTSLRLAGHSDKLLGPLHEFLSTRLLLWIEILNLKHCVGDGVDQLRQAHTWLKGINAPSAIYALINDAQSFLTQFLQSPLSGSTPHIYISMLPFWPEDRPISLHYKPRMSGLVRVRGYWIRDGLPEDVQAVAYSPIGAKVAIASSGQTIHIFDTYNEQRLDRLIGSHMIHTIHTTYSVAFSADGTRIASGSMNGTIYIWDVHTGQLIGQSLEGHADVVRSVAYSPDGARIISGSDDKTVRIWDAHTGQPVGRPLEGHTDGVRSVVYSPDSAYIVSGSMDSTIRIWDARTREPVGQPLRGHKSQVLSVAYSPDGTHIVSGSGDNTVRVWDAHTGQPEGQPLEGHTGAARSVAYSPDGARVVSASFDGTICIWDVRTGQRIGQPLKSQGYEVCLAAYSLDGARIVSASTDGAICTWDARHGRLMSKSPEGHGDWVTSVTYSPDGAYIASGSRDDTIRIWDANTEQLVGRPLEGHTDEVWSVVYSPDGLRIVSGSWDNTVRIWDVHTGQPIGEPLRGHESEVVSAVYSPDGAYIASGSYDKTIRIWDANTGQLVGQPLEGHTNTIWSVAWSPDGERIVSGSRDGTIRIWNAHTGQPVGEPLRGHKSSVYSVAYSPDGTHIASGSGDFTVRIWDANTGQPIGQPFQGHTSLVLSVAYSHDGTRVVTSSGDGTVRIWDAHTGQPVGQPLKGHTKTVHSVAYSPDGTRIVSGSYDFTIRIWDICDNLATVRSSNNRAYTPVCSTTLSLDSECVSETNDKSPYTQDMHLRQIVEPSLSGDDPVTAHPAHTSEVVVSRQATKDSPTSEDRMPWDDWSLDGEGWVVSPNQDRLIWVPAYARKILLLPHNRVVIAREGSLSLDFQGAKLGEDWRRCFADSVN